MARSTIARAGVRPEEKKKATFNLTAALHQRLKIAAAMTGREMVAIVEEALEAQLGQMDRHLRKKT
jgi:predicted DNA-binding protein